MDKETKQLVNELCNSVIMVADTFIKKCETGKARSVETLHHMFLIRQDAERVKKTINTPPQEETKP